MEMCADEIEVTDDMRRAGAQLLGDFYDSPGGGVDGLVAERVFRAMWERRIKT